ncbi:MAG: 16S rRNA (cytidine(1402)-2'-O)-methyltransferase [Candidatus Yanofskybacteria bacterium RIFCSPHIGHO2_02_FULL_41_11]|uniref:Ribosomal RNA small subunit methyltransferase I n=1 Tax=Candidatus Yanofskybacteria bacterium RIFCSPHIGHO2_02_FULL_41_11 TaxID=1802675 RepID=A0A1F8F7E5_9BACT|nr:MAG: 16S rRNA (cytidine(1402)-2'-O)-methyltransferase [Candidatus Yanofskybacteria bacterium RIFCSPHIGHO2_02_FULL_41_11]
MLYIVATPIGNLEDITLRAISVLKSADFILAEDTRITRTLLSRYNINKPLISYHQHSKIKKINEIVGLLKENKTLSLVSDAGTPGINDPGNFLIQEILKELPDLKIIPIPGPNAAITALSVSGFPADKFVFLGFPPHKKGRQTFFKKIGEIEETIVFYESKHRIMKALEELRTVSNIGGRPLVVARELTKQFETIYRGTVSEVASQLNKTKVLGEFVVVVRAQ